ncbi:15888_t:CDS:1, partial [Racocetra fulgida]
IKIIEQYDDIEILLIVEDSEVTMISFGVKDIINQLSVNTVEIGIDAMCMCSYRYCQLSLFLNPEMLALW